MDTGQENNEALLNPEPEAPARFPNRHEAGDLLAAVLTAYRDTDALVLGIPRGGVIVAAAVARRLGAELDAVISRKIAVPAQPELAMGAVTADGGVYVNERTVAAHDVSGEQLAAAIARETAEAKARQEQPGTVSRRPASAAHREPDGHRRRRWTGDRSDNAGDPPFGAGRTSSAPCDGGSGWRSGCVRGVSDGSRRGGLSNRLGTDRRGRIAL
jgi:hypothetical protein